jgi:hypothetical protein
MIIKDLTFMSSESWQKKRNNGAEKVLDKNFPVLEKHKPADSRSRTNSKQDKPEEINSKTQHNYF